MSTLRHIYETIYGVLFLIFIGGCYLFVFAGLLAIMWAVFSALVRAAI